ISGITLALFVIFATFDSKAQPAPAANPTNISGKVVSLKGPELIVAIPSGEGTVAISEKTVVRAEVPIKFSEITSGMYVGATATKQADGNFLASQINIFSEDQRGTGEGHRPLGAATMTNANVERVEDVTVREVKGRMLNLKYKEGEINVIVPPDIPINKRVVGDRSLIKTGSEVSVTADKQADGSLTARQITVRAPKP
ncbi:MAG TPA: DUF5666 domain-containing protein, partial [Candidatus Limnocylindrales bacterium]|nr:DUF5666 domain-containing protein [Candidatus Limnocylindrales bacterium]